MRFGSRYDSFDDPYCYPGTFVLKNKLALTEDSQLEAFEHESVSAKAEEKLPSGPFDPKHYGDIHRHLFGEVYEWAGDYRTVRTAKGGDMFCYPEFIAEQMDLLFGILQNAPLFGRIITGRFRYCVGSVLGRSQRHPSISRRQWTQPVKLSVPIGRTRGAPTRYVTR